MNRQLVFSLILQSDKTKVNKNVYEYSNVNGKLKAKRNEYSLLNGNNLLESEICLSKKMFIENFSEIKLTHLNMNDGRKRNAVNSMFQMSFVSQSNRNTSAVS